MPAPVLLCVTFTIWSVVEPLKFVGPLLTAGGVVPDGIDCVGFVAVDSAALPSAEEFADGANTKSEIVLPPSVSASCALNA